MLTTTDINGVEPRWQAVLTRDATQFPGTVYAVRTTGIYCRADCSARRPLKKNVEFFDSPAAAEDAGYRACLRCRPDQPVAENRAAGKIAAACDLIRSREEEPSLELLARRCGMSVFHFHRTFKSVTGVTPKAFARAHRMERMREHLGSDAGSITSAIYDAGFGSSSRFYEKATRALGMVPSKYKNGGAGIRILFAVAQCSLGHVLVACSSKGVCAILFGDDPDQLLKELRERFSKADLVAGDAGFDVLVARVIRFVDTPKTRFDLPLDIRGTAFQERVWQALQEIPEGTTASYGEIAEKIGAPGSQRAVASACGANRLAVAIPCHRVVRADGKLSGYRWGTDRKRRLLEMEKAG